MRYYCGLISQSKGSDTLESFLLKVAFESNLRKKLSRIEHVLIVKVSFERRKIANVFMTHVQVFFRKSLSKATFERKLSSVSLALAVMSALWFVFSKEWAVGRLREKAKVDSRYNYLLRQSGREYRSYTLVYRNPLHSDPAREPVCLQIKQMPDTGLYQVVVVEGSPTAVASVQELITHYRRSGSSDGIALQQCVTPSNPCKQSL